MAGIPNDLGWLQRYNLDGDEDGGITLECRDCHPEPPRNHLFLEVAYYTRDPSHGIASIPVASNVPDLLAMAAAHEAERHA